LQELLGEREEMTVLAHHLHLREYQTNICIATTTYVPNESNLIGRSSRLLVETENALGVHEAAQARMAAKAPEILEFLGTKTEQSFRTLI
jgi:hypothetical protein